MKICNNCEFCLVYGTTAPGQYNYKCQKSKSIISGDFLSCDVTRSDESRCGQSGKWYTERQPPPVKIKKPFWQKIEEIWRGH